MKSLGKATTIIGWKITRDMEARTLRINQKRYIQDLLEAKGMTSCHATVFPIEAELFISIN